MCCSHDAQYCHYGFLECDIICFVGLSHVPLKKETEEERSAARLVPIYQKTRCPVTEAHDLTSCTVYCDVRDQPAQDLDI
jgi:hypothetical protein